MKKFYIFIVAMALTAGTLFAQSNDSIERLKQQEALMRQQQKEQQDLLKQQQKEQERLAKEQQKEEEQLAKEQQKAEEKLAKEQQKEAEKALKKEQDRQKREQVKAENERKAAEKKAAQKAKRQENYAKWGRKPGFTADPYASALIDRRVYTQNSLYNSVGINLGVNFNYRRPIAKRMDFNIGLGYRQSMYYYSHLKGAETDFAAKEENRTIGTVVLPVSLSFINKDNQHGWYLGVTPGFNLKNVSAEGAAFNRFRCDAVIGTQNRWLIFAPGTELYFNLAPTYTSGDTKIHEIGIRFTL
ncbi:MAG: hypothetical protein MJZ45_02785 [Bacteroidales bacterium]|nr:hypothetical protein [Bacteroidales bacterium]